MNGLSIKKQLSFAFAALVAVVMLVSAVALRGLAAADARFAGFVHGIDERESMAVDVRIAANRRAIGVRDMVIVKEAADVESARKMALDAHSAIGEHLRKLKDAVAAAPEASPRERELVARLLEVEGRYGPVAANIVELASSGRRDEAMTAMTRDCRPLLAALLAATREYVDFAARAADEEIAASTAQYQAQRWWLTLLSLAAVARLRPGLADHAPPDERARHRAGATGRRRPPHRRRRPASGRRRRASAGGQRARLDGGDAGSTARADRPGAGLRRADRRRQHPHRAGQQRPVVADRGTGRGARGDRRLDGAAQRHGAPERRQRPAGQPAGARGQRGRDPRRRGRGPGGRHHAWHPREQPPHRRHHRR
ncbi:hypothetical protein FUT87_18930, partial [Mitsuaria sp. TWR114]